MMPDTIKDIIC